MDLGTARTQPGRSSLREESPSGKREPREGSWRAAGRGIARSDSGDDVRRGAGRVKERKGMRKVGGLEMRRARAMGRAKDMAVRRGCFWLC